MPIGNNRVLGDSRLSPEARPHRVAMANWPASVNDPRVATLDALLGHVQSAGYEGLEFGVAYFRKYFPDASDAVIARRVREALEKRGLRNFGSTLHAPDELQRSHEFLEHFIEQMKLIVELGGEFVSFQMNISAQYQNTAGLYREDERYLRFCAERVKELRDAAWELGLNFYNEVHVDRITEDPAACCRLLELATCELNGDLSHLLCRGFTKGRYVQTVCRHVGHTHVRMARMYGDLSAVVEDPRENWLNHGETWQLFQLMKPALQGGLSSRTISGETGPAFLVRDTLSQDASLVPLYRAMARYADASAQGMTIKVESPEDFNPFG